MATRKPLVAVAGGLKELPAGDTLSSGSPVGALVYGLTAPDSTYKECNGQVLTQATYPELFAQVGILPNFTNTSKGVLCSSTDIAYSSSLGLYVAVGSSGISVSTDGETWDAVGMPAGVLVSLTTVSWASTIGVFVASGAFGYVFTSTDGRKWDVTETFSSVSLGYVAASPTLILVVQAGPDLDGGWYCFTSTDGTTFTRKLIVASTSPTITAVHYAGSLASPVFLIGGTSGFGIYYATDPTSTWSSSGSAVNAAINAFASSGSLVVAVGVSGMIQSSATGTSSWTTRVITPMTTTLTGVAYSATATIPWIAQGTSVTVSSTDGTTWVVQNALSSGGKANIAWTGTKYVHAGALGFVGTSTDLSSITGISNSFAGASISCASNGSGTVVVVNSSTSIWQSTDHGSTFISRTPNAGGNGINHIKWCGGSINLFVAACNNATIITSPDGQTWTSRASNITGSPIAVGFDATNNVVVIITSSGKITRSTDGTTYAAQTTPIGSGMTTTGIARNSSTWCIVGTGFSCTSADGTTWAMNLKVGTTALTWVESDDTSFSAISGTILLSSTDGITFSRYDLPYSLLGLMYQNSLWIGCATSGAIVTSADGKGFALASMNTANQTTGRMIFAGGKYLLGATGANGAPAVSTNGVTYGRVVQNGAASSAAYSASQTKTGVAGSNGFMAYSTNSGTTWTKNYSFTAASSLSGCTYSSSLDMFCIVSGGMLYTSPDFITWTPRPIALPKALSTITTVYWVAGSINLFVAIGAGGFLATSANGTAWTVRTTGIQGALVSLAYNTSLATIAIVGNLGIILTSTNGTSYTPRNSGTTSFLTSVTSLEANGFLTGATPKLISADGVTWAEKSKLNSVVPTALSTYNAVDSTILVSNAANNAGIFFTRNGMTETGKILLVSAPTALTYDSVADKYIAFQAGACVILTRTHDKATEFSTPLLPNTWIKALP